MNFQDLQISLIDMVMSLSQATDMVCPTVANHQKRVAYMASSLAQSMGLDHLQRNRLLMAGAMHDVGALSLAERLSALDFDADAKGMRAHSLAGAALLRTFPPFADIAPLVAYHHQPFSEYHPDIPWETSLLHLCDRVDVLLNHNQPLLPQVNTVCQRLTAESQTRFNPEVVSAFLTLAKKESFWLDMKTSMLERALRNLERVSIIELDLPGLTDLARLFSQIVDFRSRFTSTHSSGVAASAKALARLAGLSQAECEHLRVAGYLHDLGKLAIPTEILEKNGRLTEVEFSLVRSHTFYTFRTLQTVRGLETMAAWAAHHHERLDGTGYPFRHGEQELTLKARIIAVADVFTAVSEDRPYRSGMDRDAAGRVLNSLAAGGGLDPRLVELLLDNYQQLDWARRQEQDQATQTYQQFWLKLPQAGN
ncbi:MAG: HD-GYP domain-containing protein [Bacillota bacterium]